MKKNSVGLMAGLELELTVIASGIVLVIGTWLVWNHLQPVIVLPAYGFYWLSLKIADMLQFLDGRQRETLDHIESVLGSSDGGMDRISWEEFKSVRSIAAGQMRFVSAFIISACVGVIYRFGRNERFKRKFSMDGERHGTGSLFRYQSGTWQNGLASLLYDPEGRDGSNKLALNPVEWLEVHEISYSFGQLDRVTAMSVLRKQLGPRWRGFENAGLNIRTFIVLCAMHMIGHPDSENARSEVVVAWSEGGDGSRVSEKVVRKHSHDLKTREAIEFATRSHAYESTAACSMLEQARKYAGVLPCSVFLWLRELDRTLWFSIQNVGRKAYFVEGLAAATHFKEEKKAANPIIEIEPTLNIAIKGIEQFMEEEEVSFVCPEKIRSEESR